MTKRYSEACERNKEPILNVLTDYFDGVRSVFEVGSGTGQHAVFFAKKLPSVQWQPADRDGHLQSIETRRREADLRNLKKPIEFDLFDESMPLDSVDAVVAINVLQIAPPDAISHLFRHAGRLLDNDGIVYLYGPYRYRDAPLEPSNQKFHQHLQNKDPDMGIPLFENVEGAADGYGFELVEDREMPANNRSLVWQFSD